MRNHTSEDDVNFPKLVERSSEIFRELRLLTGLPKQDLIVVRELVAEGQLITERMRFAVIADRLRQRMGAGDHDLRMPPRSGSISLGS